MEVVLELVDMFWGTLLAEEYHFGLGTARGNPIEVQCEYGDPACKGGTVIDKGVAISMLIIIVLVEEVEQTTQVVVACG